MNYAELLTTKILATSCACCARPLLDAESVECGIGPICREKHGYDRPQGATDWPLVVDALVAVVAAIPDSAHLLAYARQETEERKIANALVHAIALRQDGEAVLYATITLRALGYVQLAEVIADRLGAVRATVEGETISLYAGFSNEFNAAVRTVPGARWDAARRARTAPVRSAVELYLAIGKAFPRRLLIAPHATVIVGAPVESFLAALGVERATESAAPVAEVRVHFSGNTVRVDIEKYLGDRF